MKKISSPETHLRRAAAGVCRTLSDYALQWAVYLQWQATDLDKSDELTRV